MRGDTRNYDGNSEAHKRFFFLFLRFGGEKGICAEATFFIHTAISLPFLWNAMFWLSAHVRKQCDRPYNSVDSIFP
jgi:hypothetical protein